MHFARVGGSELRECDMRGKSKPGYQECSSLIIPCASAALLQIIPSETSCVPSVDLGEGNTCCY